MLQFMKKLCWILCYLICSFSAFSQTCDRVYITGTVVDTTRIQGFYNLMVVNTTYGKAIFGQPNGHFSLYGQIGDSITLSVKGYAMAGFKVKADSNCQMKINVILDYKAEKLQEVVVRPLKSLQQIKEERENLSLRESKTVTGINVLASPITALYQAFSKKEKAKAWIAQMEYKDDQRKVVKELLRLYTAYNVVELYEDEFDDFIDFLNVDENFLKTATEMELVTFIKDKYEHFMRLKNK